MTSGPDPTWTTPTRRALALVAAVCATALTMVLLDLLWLGVIARDLYARGLGSLARPAPFLPAAGLFYAFYVGAIVVHASGAGRAADAARRGAGLGLVAYATYELTNWAVLRDWPAWLVPIDVAWGVLLTALAAAAGQVARARTTRREAAP
jgi:uncharacterized membrane protein